MSEIVVFYICFIFFSFLSFLGNLFSVIFNPVIRYKVLFAKYDLCSRLRTKKGREGLNFINVLFAHFLLKVLAPKITKANVTREKLLNLLSYEKCAPKMLMKLTQRKLIVRQQDSHNIFAEKGKLIEPDLSEFR